MHLFKSVTAEMALAALKASAEDIDPDTLRENVLAASQRARAAYAGGEAAIEMLLRKEGETGLDWSSRQNHYRNVPVTKLGVNMHAWLLYGNPVSWQVWVGGQPITLRDIQDGAEGDETNERVGDWFRDTFEENKLDALKLAAAKHRNLDGRASIKFWGVGADGEAGQAPFQSLRMDVFAADKAIPIYDPADRGRLLAMMEYLADGIYRIHTAQDIAVLDGDRLTDDGAHPLPGFIPWAVLGNGTTDVADLVEYQKVLINRHSIQWSVERAQGFSVPVIKGTPGNLETEIGGVRGMTIGPKRYMYFPDPAGGFTFASPDAPIDELRASYESELSEAMTMGADLPQDVALGGTQSAEQPTTIAFRWLKAMIRRDGSILGEATDFENQIFHIVGAFGYQHFGLPGTLEALDWDVQFPDSVLPIDDREDRAMARAEVGAGLRTDSDYVGQYVVPDATPAEMADYLEELKAQTQADSSRFGAEQLPPPIFPDDDQ